MTSAFPLNADTLLATFNALPARTCILAFLIVLPATLATKLDKFRSFSHMNTLFSPCNASRARSLIITLDAGQVKIASTTTAQADLLIIPTTVLASQFCTVGF
jgi:hypothetical protein